VKNLLAAEYFDFCIVCEQLLDAIDPLARAWAARDFADVLWSRLLLCVVRYARISASPLRSRAALAQHARVAPIAHVDASP